MKILELLKKKVMFIESYTPFDYTKNIGQYALEINYTNGDKDVFTTPMPANLGNDRGDFKDLSEFKKTVDWLKNNCKRN